MGITGYQVAMNKTGERGVAGPLGPRGVKGEAGINGQNADHRNWKECVWRSDDSRDIGSIKVS